MVVFGSGLLLCLLCLGKEFRVWSIDGETLDKMTKFWVGGTIAAAAAGALIAHVAIR